MSERLQVVFCTDGIFPHAVGGMQKHSKLLVEELARMNVLDLIVIHPHHDKKVFDASLGIIEIAIERGKKYWSYMYNEYRYSMQVAKELEKYPSAVIYSQGLSVWHNARKYGKRMIVNPHGLEFYQAITLPKKLKALRFSAAFNRLFAVSAKVVSLGGRLTALLHKNISRSEKKVVVLPNAVNMPNEKTERVFHKEPMQVLFVGRFASNKGINILMDAVRELNKEGYQNILQFNLVGKGPLFEMFSTTFKAPNVNYLGFADDDKLVELYKQNDLFVLPTFFEGMPTVVLEAMSYGMPIIVTDTGATTDLVNDSNGYIIEKADVKSLKNALLNFYQLDDAKKKMLSINSYNKVKDNFTWKVVAQKHYELFRAMQMQ
jgi:glycosyltransferase involved in cell wall biosynthesis